MPQTDKKVDNNIKGFFCLLMSPEAKRAKLDAGKIYQNLPIENAANENAGTLPYKLLNVLTN